MSTPSEIFFDIEPNEIASLASVEEIGAVSWGKVRRSFKSLSSFLSSPAAAQRQTLTENKWESLRNRRKVVLPKSIRLVTIDDPDYPPLLKEIADPPLWLFAVGDINCLHRSALAVVGSRKHSAYAAVALEQLLQKDLLEQVTIVSGLAYGIDKLAHQAAVDAGGKTAAVLAGGLDKIYPTGHRGLAKAIIEGSGVLVSEYPPGSPAWATKFPVRNRIIAGLCRATIVVEAALKSGTMTTAKSVVDYNRDLFAVPGDITRTTSEGANFLIGQGATPLLSASQLNDYYNIKTAPAAASLLDPGDQTLVDLLAQPVRIDQLVSDTGQSVEAVLQKLTALELAGHVYQARPGYYQIKKHG